MATLKNDWQSGEQFNASDANAIATEVNAKYVKPATGVPITDLTASVQVSLGKADTAIQAVAAVNISDSTSTGRAVLTAADSSAARTALGVAYGTAAGTVAQGNDSRFSPTATSISDSTATGRAVLTATDASAARSAIGLGSVSLSADDTAAATAAATAKATPVDADVVPLVDSAASNVLKKLSWANLKAAFKAYYDDVTATLTNKTLTSPRINSILDTNGATSLVLNARASAVNYIAVYNEATGVSPAFVTFGSDQNVGLDLAPKGTGAVAIYTQNGITGSTLSATGVGTNKDLNLTTKGTGTVQANGVPVVTTTGTAALTNKTISGASNTVTNLPASATPDAARRVVLTPNGGSTTETGANTWVKIATFSSGTNTFTTASVLLAVTNGNATTSQDTAVVSVFVSSRAVDQNPVVTVDYVAKGGSGAFLTADSFKIIGGAWSSDVELWMRKGAASGRFAIYEISRLINGAMSLTYHDNFAWQSAEPVGAVNNLFSNGVTAFGVPVVTTTGTQTLTNKTLTSPRINSILDTNGATSLVLNARPSAVNYIRLFNEAAGASPAIVAEGSDTNIGFDIATKGTGAFAIYTPTGITGSTLSATGVGTNKDLNLTTKGTGTVQANGVPVVTTTGTQTLTNKTLTTPAIFKINNLAGGTALATGGAGATAVNWIQVEGAATGSTPAVYGWGTDTNINLNLATKGTGTVQANGVPVVTTTGTQALSNKTLTTPVISAINTTNGRALSLGGSENSVNNVFLFSEAAGGGPQIAAVGTDTNINLLLYGKGTGTVQANGNPVVSRVSVPATATSTGTAGTIAYDSSYVYICTAANTWRRAAIAAW